MSRKSVHAGTTVTRDLHDAQSVIGQCAACGREFTHMAEYTYTGGRFLVCRNNAECAESMLMESLRLRAEAEVKAARAGGVD